MKHFLLLIFTSLFLVTSLFSSYPQNTNDINQIFESIQKSRAISYAEISEFSESEFEILIQKLVAVFSAEEDPSFRLRAYRFMYLVGQKFTELSPDVAHFLIFEGLPISII